MVKDGTVPQIKCQPFLSPLLDRYRHKQRPVIRRYTIWYSESAVKYTKNGVAIDAVVHMSRGRG
jgi:NADPH-dependent ferric siderophore reductase